MIDVYDGRIIFNEKVYRSESGLFELHFHRSKVFPGIAAIQANGTKLYNGVIPETFDLTLTDVEQVNISDDQEQEVINTAYEVSYDLQFVDQMVVVAETNGIAIERPVVRTSKGKQKVQIKGDDPGSLHISDRHKIELKLGGRH